MCGWVGGWVVVCVCLMSLSFVCMNCVCFGISLVRIWFHPFYRLCGTRLHVLYKFPIVASAFGCACLRKGVPSLPLSQAACIQMCV